MITGAYDTKPEVYQEFENEPGYINGKAHYTSADGKWAIAYSGSNWYVQPVSQRYLITMVEV